MSRIKNLLFKLKLKLSSHESRASVYAKYLGVNFGTNVRITDYPNFGSEPYLITIGNDVTITEGVTFHTHDGGVGVLRTKYPGIDIFKPVKVGNNVFLGFMVNIMPGITIGNNVIIGACSLVTKDVPDNVVVAGVPAKVIRTLAEYEAKVLKDAVYIKSRHNPEERKNEILNTLNLKK